MSDDIRDEDAKGAKGAKSATKNSAAKKGDSSAADGGGQNSSFFGESDSADSAKDSVRADSQRRFCPKPPIPKTADGKESKAADAKTADSKTADGKESKDAAVKAADSKTADGKESKDAAVKAADSKVADGKESKDASAKAADSKGAGDSDSKTELKISSGKSGGDDDGLKYDATMPVVPLRDVVVFPRVVLSLYVGRRISLDALNKAMEEGGRVFLATQKSADTDAPEADDLYAVGCAANVLQMLRLPDGTVKVLVEGVSRGKAEYAAESGKAISAEVSPLPIVNRPSEDESVALRRAFRSAVAAYAKVNPKVGDDLSAKMKEIDDIERLADHIVSFFPLSIKKRQKMLEDADLTARARGAAGAHRARNRSAKN